MASSSVGLLLVTTWVMLAAACVGSTAPAPAAQLAAPQLTPTSTSAPVTAILAPLPAPNIEATIAARVQATVEALETPSAGITPSPTASFSANAIPFFSSTSSPIPTMTQSPTPSPTLTPTLTATSTRTPTATATLTATATRTPTPTQTFTPKPSLTPLPSHTPTATHTVTRTLTPTPTPIPIWETYVNPDFEYWIVFRQNWTVDDSSTDVVYFWQPDNMAFLRIYMVDISAYETLDSFTDYVIDFRESQDRVLFEMISRRDIILDSGVNATRVRYLWQSDANKCVSERNEVVVLFGSRAFGLVSEVCENSVAEFGDDVVDMQNSFVALEPLVTPTPVPVPTKTSTPFTFGQPGGGVIESCIESDFEGWSGDTLFELCNGQIWIQSSYAYVYHYAYRPDVTITSIIGGYEMTVEAISDSIRVVQITDFIRSRIDGVFHGFRYGNVFALRNGQIWEQTSSVTRSRTRTSPDVLEPIRKAQMPEM